MDKYININKLSKIKKYLLLIIGFGISSTFVDVIIKKKEKSDKL